MNRNFILFTIVIFAFSSNVYAGTPPLPPKKETLSTLETKLKAQEKSKKHLEKQVKEIENALGDTKKRLIDTSRSIQKSEAKLQGIEGRIDNLEAEQTALQDKLKQDRQSIARLVLALERIRRVPPEALIAKPSAPLKTAQSAMLMRDIIPALNQQAENLRINLEDLEAVSRDLNKQRHEALETVTALNEEHKKLSGLVERREKLFVATHKDLEEQQRSVKTISKQAQNLQDLVQRLDKKKAEQQAAAQAQPKALPPAGDAQLPISGIIRVSYNQTDAFGAPSKGISIEGVGGALVVAPMGGTVRFTGPFKNYGNLIILEHKNGYHSLIAGFEKIDTVVGQSVSAGEPLGLLHYAINGQKPALYYELRHDGKAINPSLKLGSLG